MILDNKIKNLPIGIFDSGIGGVTVLRELIKVLPNENYIYYSDSKNNPYGDKEEKEIIKICDDIVKKLLEKNCKMIVIACNTASAISAKYLREKYTKIPILAIEPAFKMINDYAKNEKSIVMATKGTIKSKKFQELANKYYNENTIILPCIGLAEIIEKNDNSEIEKYLEENLRKYKGKVQDIVLGCTHYPLIKDEISNVLGKVNFFDGAKGVAKNAKNILEKRDLLNNQETTEIKFIDSNNNIKKKERFLKFIK